MCLVFVARSIHIATGFLTLHLRDKMSRDWVLGPWPEDNMGRRLPGLRRSEYPNQLRIYASMVHCDP